MFSPSTLLGQAPAQLNFPLVARGEGAGLAMFPPVCAVSRCSDSPGPAAQGPVKPSDLGASPWPKRRTLDFPRGRGPGPIAEAVRLPPFYGRPSASKKRKFEPAAVPGSICSLVWGLPESAQPFSAPEGLGGPILQAAWSWPASVAAARTQCGQPPQAFGRGHRGRDFRRQPYGLELEGAWERAAVKLRRHGRLIWACSRGSAFIAAESSPFSPTGPFDRGQPPAGGLIGKGVTFDSGGYNLKDRWLPRSRMMKYDHWAAKCRRARTARGHFARASKARRGVEVMHV